MARKYSAPVILAGPIDDSRPSLLGDLQFTRDQKDDIASSFVYGDVNYEEEYVIPDVAQEVAAAPSEEESIEE